MFTHYHVILKRLRDKRTRFATLSYFAPIHFFNTKSLRVLLGVFLMTFGVSLGSYFFTLLSEETLLFLSIQFFLVTGCISLIGIGIQPLFILSADKKKRFKRNLKASLLFRFLMYFLGMYCLLVAYLFLFCKHVTVANLTTILTTYSMSHFLSAWFLGTVILTFTKPLLDKMNETQKPRDFDRFGLWVGDSTGDLARLSHGAAMASKKPVVLSLLDACKNTLILGGIGTGKTTRIIHTLLLQLLDQDCGGLIFNIKGDFDEAVRVSAKTTHRKIKTIGISYERLNLIEGLTPEVAASFIKSAMMMGDTGKSDSFWVNTATELCRNALGALSFIPKHYHLKGLYDYIFNVAKKLKIDAELIRIKNRLTQKENALLDSYQSYYENIFNTFEDRTKSNVLATIAQVLSPFNHPDLIDFFCKDSTVNMTDVLNGELFLVELPLAVWGFGAKVIYNMIKLRFFNVMQQRAKRNNWNQTRPVFFMCDEYQEIISASKDAISDLGFWDKSRSSKTIGIVSSQSISSFYAAIGDRDCANTILGNFRQKFSFQSEDEATLSYFTKLAGKIEAERLSLSEQSGASLSLRNVSDNHSKSQTVSQIDKAVLDPQVIRTLLPNQALAYLNIEQQSRDDILEMDSIYF